LSFLRSLKKGDKVEKAGSMLKNSKRFFVCLSEGEWIFAPTRFVGFQNNSVQEHEEEVRGKNRDGRKVDPIVSKISKKIDYGSILHKSLETSFLHFCIENQTSSSTHKTPRQYWVSPQDVGLLPASSNSSWEDHAKILAETILKTVRSSGRSVTRNTKIKPTDMDKKELKELIEQRMKDQNYLCKLTGIKMKNSGDPNFYPSPDRIDSNRGYFRDNIQLVCRFANMWKSDQPNEDFLKLIKVIKNT